MPKIAADTAHSVVITGLRMKGSERFIVDPRTSSRIACAKQPERSANLTQAAHFRLPGLGWRRDPSGERRWRLIRNR